MAEIRVNPTRMELKRLKVRLSTARRGHKLLKDKRDELMKQFLDIVRKNKVLREKVEQSLSEVHKSFTVAAAVSSPAMLEEALMLPKKEGTLEVGYQNVMSVEVPVFSFNIKGEDSSDSYNYGYAFTSGELDLAVDLLGKTMQDLIALAETEKASQMLAMEIEKTRRRVNALEHILIPRLEAGIKSITMKLDENERGNLTRLMKVKDMAVKREIEANRAKKALITE